MASVRFDAVAARRYHCHSTVRETCGKVEVARESYNTDNVIAFVFVVTRSCFWSTVALLSTYYELRTVRYGQRKTPPGESRAKGE